MSAESANLFCVPGVSPDGRDACAAMRKAARALTRFYDLVLAPCGLQTTQFIMLQSLARAGEIAQSDLAALMSIGIDTLTRRLGSLRRLGLIEASVQPVAGRRKKVFRLTPKGRTALAEALPYWQHAQQRLCDAVGPDQWENLFRLCDAAVAACAEAESARMARPRRL